MRDKEPSDKELVELLNGTQRRALSCYQSSKEKIPSHLHLDPVFQICEVF